MNILKVVLHQSCGAARQVILRLYTALVVSRALRQFRVCVGNKNGTKNA